MRGCGQAGLKEGGKGDARGRKGEEVRSGRSEVGEVMMTGKAAAI